MRKRNVQILFRLTEEEAEHLNELVRKSGRSKEAFLREMVRGYQLCEKPDPEFYKMMRELSAIGNRINQLAVKANALGFVDTPMLREEARKWHEFQIEIRKRYLLQVIVMAVCEIWDVRGRLDHPIDYAENPEKTANPKYTEADLQAMVDVMEYATNKNKTEQRFFVTGVNCDPTTARDEMMITKAGWNDTSEIVCYHGFQSFKHGEVTPEQAHEVGVKLAERMWGNRFQVIVATHLNTDCLHNHFVVNSVSFADGMHYHDNKANLRLLRQRSDELCREYALSVIEHPSGKKKPYALYQAEKQGRPTRDNVARQAVDEAISKSFTLKDFDRQLAEMGYRINFDPNRKYWTIIGKGWQRPKRLYKLGEEYTNDRIMERIRENSYAVKFQSFSEPQPQIKVYRVKGSLKNAKKIGGLRGLYLHYCYKLGILPKGRKQNYARLHYLLKDDLMKMEAITQETRLLCRNHIDTAEQLCSYKGSLETEMSALLQKRKELYSKSRRISGEEKEAVKAEISDISGRLKVIRKEVRLCEGISARSDTLKEKLQTIRADENEQRRKELMKNEHRRRSGRTNRPNELGGL